MLRRTKTELSEATTFKLPSKDVHIINVTFVKEEKDVYEKVLLFSRFVFNKFILDQMFLILNYFI